MADKPTSGQANLFFESIKRSLAGEDKGGNPYDLGFDCGVNGPNTTNCSFSIFANKEATQAWERGKRAGDTQRLSPKRDSTTVIP